MTAGPSSLPADTAGLLALCDGFLREIGRREHRFSWLRPPDGGEDDWLSVDAYYPSNRVVVYAGIDPEEQLLYEELVPQHGLYLLCVDPYSLPDDPIAAQAVLRKRLEEDGWSPRPAPRPVAATSPAPARASHWTEVKNHAPEPSAAANRSAPQSTTAGIGMGLVLIVLVLVEAFLGLVVLALQNGDVILGAGVLLDAAARAVATLTAAERRSPEQTSASLLIGSPAIAVQDMPARAIAIGALVLIGLGILVSIL